MNSLLVPAKKEIAEVRQASASQAHPKRAADQNVDLHFPRLEPLSSLGID